MKKLFFVLFIMMALGSLCATVLLTDDFTGTVGQTLITNGWALHSGTGTPQVISTPGLTYGSYVGSGLGNAASTGGTSDDVNKAFTTTNTGSLYNAFMFKVTSMPNTTLDYNVMFATTSGAAVTSFWGKFYCQRDASNNVRFGVTKTAAASVGWTPYSYAYGATYLVIVKYTFVAGTPNDQVALFINPVISGTEPTPTVSGLADATADPAQLLSIALRQSANTPVSTLDGFRVATAWTDLFVLSTPVINVTSTMTSFSTVYPAISDVQQYTVAGTDLTANINVAAPTGFDVSLDGLTNWGSSVIVTQTGGVANAQVYVRYNPATAGSSGIVNLVHTSTDATTVNTPISGISYAGTIDLTNTANITPFTGALVGTPSAAKTYHVIGTNLTSTTLDLNVTGPFQIMDTTHPSPTWETTLALAPNYDGDINVRYNPVAAGTQAGHVFHSVADGEAATVDLVLSGTATLPYVVNVSTPSLAFGAIEAGTTSVYQSYNLSGSNLDVNIDVTAPVDFEVSSTSSTGPWSSTLSLAPTFSGPIYVQYKPTGVGVASANITNVSSSASANVAVTGSATMPSMPMNVQVGTTLTRNFDIIGAAGVATLPTDWRVAKSSTIAVQGTWATAGTATDRNGGNAMATTASNGIYNFGAGDAATASDRAIGFLSSGSATKSGNLYTMITNTGSTPATSFVISYKAEKYRMGFNPQGFSVKFYYSADGTTWTYAGDALKASWTPDLTNDGYATGAPGDFQTKTGTIVASLEPSASMYFCWSYGVSSLTTTTNAQALAIDDISILPKNNPICNTPTFTPAAGLQSGHVDVEILCEVAGASIYYTTNGDTPTIASTPYTAAIHLDATTTIKAVAIATDYDLSPVGSGTFTIPTDVANIAALRAITLPSTTYYKLTGEAVLTLKSATRNAKYIQDATGAVLIDDPSGTITTPYNLGDGITGIVGTLAVYTGMLQFTPAKNPGAATSTGNVVVPEVLTLAELNTTHQSKLVKINGVTFPGATGNFANPAATYTIQDASGFGVCRDQYVDLDYVGTPIPTTPKNITGIVLQYTTATTVFQLVPRSLADIADGAAPDAPINVVISVSGNDLVLNWANDATVTSWKVWASDTSPVSGYGTEPISTVTGNTCTLAGQAPLFNQRFFYVTANR